jgi:hypothetical protein
VRFPRATHPILVCRRSPQPVRAALAGIAKRREVTLHRAKTRVTRVTEGCDCLGCTFEQRPSPRSGQQAIDMVPAKAAHQTMRHHLQEGTSRRAPISPQAGVEMGHPMGTGGGPRRISAYLSI